MKKGPKRKAMHLTRMKYATKTEFNTSEQTVFLSKEKKYNNMNVSDSSELHESQISSF